MIKPGLIKEMEVLIINGNPRVGKDTFVKLLNELAIKEGKTVKHYSTISKLRHIAEAYFGYDPTNKSKMARQMLSDFKQWYTKYYDGSFKDLILEILNAHNTDYFCIMIREIEEIKRLVKFCKIFPYINYEVIEIKRSRIEKFEETYSDVDDIANNIEFQNLVTLTFYNNSTIEEFKETIRKIFFK